jgi:hypothetical protein
MQKALPGIGYLSHKAGQNPHHSSLFETEPDCGASTTPWFKKV